MSSQNLISMRVPEELALTFNSLCKITERTKTFHLKKALEQYLADYADYQIALDRLNDKDDTTISFQAMKDKLGIRD